MLATAVLACSPPAGSGGAGNDHGSRTTAEVPSAEGTIRTEAPRHRGVCWVAGPRPVTGEHLDPLLEHGVTWISQTPFGWQDRPDDPELRFHPDGDVWWGERDEGLRVTTRLARERGLRTLLKPHVWITEDSNKWTGDIAMASPQEWAAWFADYRDFLLHYAKLAEELGVEALAVGTELHRTVVERPDDWRRLVAEVREVYSGRLTYAANWHREYEEVAFWDALDFVGVQAYFPLASGDKSDGGESPSVDELVAAWEPHREALRALSARVDRRVVFTELGYRSVPGAGGEPWTWPERGSEVGSIPIDPELQTRLYEAFFRVFWDEPWFEGVYFWKWYPYGAGPGRAHDFTPQGKPAADVMRRWFTGTAQKTETVERSPEAAGLRSTQRSPTASGVSKGAGRGPEVTDGR